MIRASLYLDEDVNLIIADMPTSQGFKAVCVQEVGRKGLPDSDQFRYAVENGMVMVTHNWRDYEVLSVEYFDNGLDHAGLILARQRPWRDVAARVLTVITRFSACETKCIAFESSVFGFRSAVHNGSFAGQISRRMRHIRHLWPC